VVILHLSNKGLDSYKKDVFGDTIIIERSIHGGSKSGTTSYKIKSADDKVISSKASDLKIILEKFNIQADNPCALMSQETSKKFLNTSHPEKIYEFFERATQLSAMMEEFDMLTENKNKMEKILNYKKEIREEKRKELNIKRKEYEDVLRLKELDKEIAKTRIELTWSYVIKEEKTIIKFKEKLNLLYEEKKQIEGEFEDKDQKLEELNEDLKKYEKELENIQMSISKVIQDKQNITNELKLQEKKISKLNSDKQISINNIKSYEKAIKSINQRIEKENKKKESVKQISQNEDDNHDKEINELTEIIKNKEENLQEKEEILKKTEIDLDKIEEEIKEIQFKEQQQKKEKENINKEINKLKSHKSNKYKYFENANFTNNEQLIKLIAKNVNKFKNPPIGPIGLLLSLKDNKWSLSCEIKLKNVLKIYLVSSYEDQQLFIKLATEVKFEKYVTTVIVNYSDKLYNLNNNIPDKRFKTVLDILDLDRNIISKYPIKYDLNYLLPTILNSLIDQQKIESTILLNDVEEAKKVIFKENPKNVLECYTSNGYRIFKRFESENVITSNHSPKLFIEEEDFENIIK
jgi:chromosome segregation ATPase